jgi:hypothetical protein
MKEFTVRFYFVSQKANGDDFTRDIKVKAANSKSAENIAWLSRVKYFGALGNDNCVDCRVVN